MMTLEISIWAARKRLPDAFLGHITLPLHELLAPPHKPASLPPTTYTLQKRSSRSRVSGDLTIRLEWHPTPAAAHVAATHAAAHAVAANVAAARLSERQSSGACLIDRYAMAAVTADVMSFRHVRRRYVRKVTASSTWGPRARAMLLPPAVLLPVLLPAVAAAVVAAPARFGIAWRRVIRRARCRLPTPAPTPTLPG